MQALLVIISPVTLGSSTKDKHFYIGKYAELINFIHTAYVNY